MISNELIQAAIISKLQANTALTTWLTARNAGSEIRELQYQGTTFIYPAVRAQAGAQAPDGPTSHCYTSNSEQPFTVVSYSEGDSSRECDQLAGLVNAALIDNVLVGTGFRSLRIQVDSLIKATRIAQRLWQATGLYRCYVVETN